VSCLRPLDKCLTRFTSAPRSLTPKTTHNQTHDKYLATYSDPAADKRNDAHQVVLFNQNVVTLLVKLSHTLNTSTEIHSKPHHTYGKRHARSLAAVRSRYKLARRSRGFPNLNEEQLVA